MPYLETIVCLANSRKMSGRCLAGKEIDGDNFGEWVRPVSARPHQEISEEERRYQDGQSASLLDIVTIPMIEPMPGSYQSENHLVNAEHHWERQGRATWAQVVQAVDGVEGALWINGHSTNYGHNDQVPEAIAAQFDYSLLLIGPIELQVIVAREGDGRYGPPKRRVRASFSVNGLNYILAVTDPWIERQYLQGADGRYPLENAVICVSLGEPYLGHAYKLIAAIITPDRTQ